MLKRFFPLALGLSLALAACGAAAPAEPTISAADVQNTAVAAAWTMVAATQLAQPTATPLPPTEAPTSTPLPTFTAEPLLVPTLELPTLPALEIQPTPTLASSSSQNTCLKPLDVGAAGFLHSVRVENTTKGTVNLSLNLYQPNAFGQCGALSYTLSKNENIRISIPAGAWYAYAWVNIGSKQSTADGSFFIGDSKSDDLLRLIIKTDVIGWVGP